MSHRNQQIQQLINACIERRAAGEAIADEQLVGDHPELMPELGIALQDLQRVQEAQQAVRRGSDGGLQLRCPHCHHPIELVDESSLSDVLCPSCGSQFSLTDNSDRTFRADQHEMVNHFQLLDRVGVGAFGSVWSARDTQLDRMVALKIPRKGQLSTEDTEQFIREARAAAQLKHPHIVSVLEVGRYKDRIYIATDFIQGLDLADWLTDQQATPREAAELCATLADALQHAHDHGVVHRDLKPSNVMLDLEGEPYLMDFGLAKRDAGEITMTVDGKLLGTPAYMSPEQARGAAHDADARSDIYSLGVVLFELLTGERPFRGSTRMLLHQVLVEDAPSPSRLNANVPRDLETICLKCLEKNPDQRYPSAAQLRDDLRRYLNGEPVQARPISRAARLARWCRRQPAQATAVALTLLLAIGGPLLAAQLASLSMRESKARAVAESTGEELRRLLYVSDMGIAQTELREANIDGLIQRLERHVPGPDQRDLRGFEWYFLWSGAERSVMSTAFADMAVVDAAFAADGQSITTFNKEGWIRRRRLQTGEIESEQRIDVVNCSFGINTFGMSLDSDDVVMGTRDGKMEIHSLSGADTIVVDGLQTVAQCTAISPKADLAAMGDLAGNIVLWRRDGNGTAYLESEPGKPAHGHRVYTLSFSADGKWLVSGSKDQTAVIWDLETQQPWRTFDLDPHCEKDSSVWSAELTKDGKTLATGTSGDFVTLLWDVESGRLRQKLDSTKGTVHSLSFSPSGQQLATMSRTIHIWDVTTGHLLDELLNPITGDGGCVRHSPDGHSLFSSTRENVPVKIWDLRARRNPQTIGGIGDIRCGATSPDRRTFLIGHDCGEISLWDVHTRRELGRLKHGDQVVWRTSFSSDGSLIATADMQDVVIWDTSTREIVKRIHVDDGFSWAVSFSSDDRLLATCFQSGKVRIWDTQTWQLVQEFDSHHQCVSACFVADSDVLVVSGYDLQEGDLGTKIKWWDVSDPKLLRSTTLGLSAAVPWTIGFSPDGQYLAAGTYEGHLELIDAETGQIVQSLRGHDGRVSAFVFSEDSTSVYTADKKRVRIWDLPSGELRFELAAHGDEIFFVGLADDERTLITASVEETIKFWQAATQNEVAAMRQRHGTTRSVGDLPGR